MSILEAWRVAIAGVASNKLRSLLTTLGIVIGVAAVISLVSVGQGATQSITESMQGMGTNLIIITPQGAAVELTVDHATQLDQRVANLTAVAPVVSSGVTLKWSATDYQTQLNGTVPSFIEVRAYELADGRFVAESDLELNRRVAVIGQTVVAEVFKGRDAVGQTIMISGQQFTVVGVLAAKGTTAGQDQDDLVIVPLTTAQRLLSSTRITTIYGKLSSPEAATTTIAQIKSIMERLLGRADQIRVQSQDELLATIDSMTQTMTIMLGAIAGISLLVGGIGIMNIMLVSVTERTREIGLRKAVGARRVHIMTQFMVEALVISLGGGLIGAAFGILGSGLIAKLGSWNTAVTTASVLLAFGFAAIIGVGFGIYPAIKASALDPITALRYE